MFKNFLVGMGLIFLIITAINLFSNNADWKKGSDLELSKFVEVNFNQKRMIDRKNFSEKIITDHGKIIVDCRPFECRVLIDEKVKENLTRDQVTTLIIERIK